MTPHRQALIDAHVAETRRLMTDLAFDMNDLVRFAIAASRAGSHKVYYPMDPVNEGIRQWATLRRRLAQLTRDVERSADRLGVLPFDAEQPADCDPPTRPET